ncbi:hypothetical protein [Undibacterium baiyunense]|uniref:Uncharacterized protein n=1 Tax=Undibacterium baiyunense TaxID=2828731 RepID=A0A941DDU6_9BURK|nr:hypothetical protein [Undibacterium baiyunense]MBR7746909.1 hypothetical protein [Undibacterium baiyunense]
MSNNTDIEICGSFKATDATGKEHSIKGIRIYDEGYGIIDVFVDFAAPMEAGTYRDKTLVQQILSQLRKIGYVGPDFEATDPSLQERKMIVLEAPEEFCQFAKTKGWKNLAEEFE